jgi:hypothetical protein
VDHKLSQAPGSFLGSFKELWECLEDRQVKLAGLGGEVAVVEELGRSSREAYLQRYNKDGHFNSLWGRSRPARTMKGERGKVLLKDRNCATMSFAGEMDVGLVVDVEFVVT